MHQPLDLYMVFHLNLAFSAIDVEERPQVVARCYRRLLDVIERTGTPCGIEATVYTLEAIRVIDRDWIARLRGLIETGLVELVGSGRAQIIGPLVPASVNRANLRIGQAGYQALLGVQPKLALVNEQAFSAGLVDLYREAGFEALMMEWDNPASLHPEWPREWAYLPQRLRGQEAELPVVWNHSIAFQKFQRHAHGEVFIDDYIDYLASHRSSRRRALPLYGNDVEIFDFRPGRFETEAELGQDSEWQCIEALFERLGDDERFRWQRPSEVLALLSEADAGHCIELGSARCPVPVKKQRKYNLSRWAISGRDDLWLNSLCHRIADSLQNRGGEELQWRTLCDLWASDLRTHITPGRWAQAVDGALALAAELGVAPDPAPFDFHAADPDLPREVGVRMDPDRGLLVVNTPRVTACFNLRRGLCARELGFDGVPLLGTLAHGYFDDIELGADFYTGGCVVELPAEHRRLTDLGDVVPRLSATAEWLHVDARVDIGLGVLHKRWSLGMKEDAIAYRVWLDVPERPHGTVRVGHFTLLPSAFAEPLEIGCRNGGELFERYGIGEDIAQDAPASTLVSARTGLGATDGVVEIGDARTRLRFEWDPGQCAAFPMLHYRRAAPGFLARLIFSLAELDETRRAGGRLLPFGVTIRPAGSR